MTVEEHTLDDAARRELAALARAGVESAVLHRPEPTAAEVAGLCRRHPSLGQAMGAFVTIYVEGQLRGCLGEVEPEGPLADVVLRCARRVALYDRRFLPVRAAEVAALTFSVSVLTPPEPVTALDEIQIGTHGLIVRHDGHAGLLLPDVPVEYGWDVKTFLTHLWRKAGLSPRVSVARARLWRFRSQIISSEEFTARKLAEG